MTQDEQRKIQEQQDQIQQDASAQDQQEQQNEPAQAQQPKITTVRLAKMGMLVAVSVILVYLIHLPIFPAVAFLEYDPADIPILLGTFAFGPVAGVLLTVVTSVIQGLTVSAASGVYGILMHIIATSALVITAGLIYTRNKTRKNRCYRSGLRRGGHDGCDDRSQSGDHADLHGCAALGRMAADALHSRVQCDQSRNQQSCYLHGLQADFRIPA